MDVSHGQVLKDRRRGLQSTASKASLVPAAIPIIDAACAPSRSEMGSTPYLEHQFGVVQQLKNAPSCPSGRTSKRSRIGINSQCGSNDRRECRPRAWEECTCWEYVDGTPYLVRTAHSFDSCETQFLGLASCTALAKSCRPGIDSVEEFRETKENIQTENILPS